MELFERIVAEEGQVVPRLAAARDRQRVARRRAPGPSSRTMFHALIGRGPRISDADAFERKLYVIRKRFETAIEESGLDDHKFFYFSSLSCRTLVYKGMLTPEPARRLLRRRPGRPAAGQRASACSTRGSRTNTFPSWQLAHPYRMISHNGEINTLRGNINWMRAREALFASELYEPGDVEKLLPIIREGLSDTACLDNAIELLVRSGYSLPHAMMMLIPEAWENHETMSQVKKDFYAYHSCLMEPWDGPASIGFTDGKNIGAVLDRNGLRPSRYVVTKDGLVIMASEVGRPGDRARGIVLKKGRLEPGKMFLVDLEQGRIVDDEELKHADRLGQALRQVAPRVHGPAGRAARRRPTSPAPTPRRCSSGSRRSATRSRTSSTSSARWATNGEEAIGSMGNDTPLAVLSDRAQPLFNYFKQLFAQVTNPPLDAIREELVTSVLTGAGGEGNLLMPTPESCRQIALDLPILDNDELAKLKQLDGWRGFKSVTLPMLFPAAEGAAGMERALEALFEKASAAIEAGANLIILSDRGVDAEMAADPVAPGLRGPAPPPGPPGPAVPRRADRSSAATPARSTTSPSCSATAPGRSTRTSPSRRSTT